MTLKQSLTRKQSLIRRCLTVLSAALLVAAWNFGISIPASAAPPVKGFLEITSLRNTDKPDYCHPTLDQCLIVQGQEFAVQVRVLDKDRQPTTVSKATRIVLEKASGDGSLDPEASEVTIPRNGSTATFSGVSYSPYENDVVLRVRVLSGVELSEDTISVDFALTAVDDIATPGNDFDLQDPECGVGGAPTPEEPICGHLLTKGADGLVIMSVGSCEDLGPCRTVDGTTALVVTLVAQIEHPDPTDPYSIAILACDKVLCGGSGVPKLPVIYTFDNNADLTETAPACPGKGDLGTFDICVDYVQSTRSQGDLYLWVLFNRDLRYSG
jgi:hypothetical protein